MMEGIIQRVYITDLPEEVVEFIFFNLSPYRDLLPAKLVCKQWYRLIHGVISKLEQNFHAALSDSRVIWTKLSVGDGPSVTERYSHCACYYEKSLYIFGGCTSTNTTFNDLWRFNLVTRQWIRPLAMGTYPSPKACASMVMYKDSLILFGGWSHPTPYPLHQAARFFNELHMYTPQTNRWSCITSCNVPHRVAGHSACIVKNLMVVFGGSHFPGVGCNDVWVFDFCEMNWHKEEVASPKPSPRYGQSQIAIDDSNILVIGGCGGPNQIFNDMWRLCLESKQWRWEKIKIDHPEYSAPQLWCHPACKVENMVIVLSKPAKSMKLVPVLVPMGSQIKVNRVWVPPREDELPLQATSSSQPGCPRFGHKRLAHELESSSAEDSDDEQMLEMQESLDKDVGSFKNNFKTPLNETGTKNHNELQASNNNSAFRQGPPSVRPNSMRNRQKQLEMLKRYEEKIKRQLVCSSFNKDFNSERSYPQVNEDSNVTTVAKEPRSLMHLHIFEIKNVLTDNTVTWQPVRENMSDNIPEEAIFYSLVEGRGELIMFGGIQRDISSMQRGIHIKSHVVSNNLYFLSAPKPTF